jgi:3-oxoacyl-[acyl-carrier-protein] synthase-1
MTRRLGLPALGLATPLGSGKGEVAEALFAGGRSGLAPRDDLVPGRSIHAGSVAGPLPPVPGSLAAFD